MLTQTPSVSQSTVRETACAYCGSTNEPMRGKDIRVLGPRTWKLAVACTDARACAQRAKERDRHLDERYALTPAGLVAALFIEQTEQLHLPPAA
jgi:hypothetical protein